MKTQSYIPRLAGIRLHPIKALDPVSVTEARIGPNGGLELDRAWALYSADGRWVNGKRTAAIHLIRAEFAPDVSTVRLAVPGDRRNIPAREFAFPADFEQAAEWFSVYFEQQIIVRYAREGFPDDALASGPTIVSTASLQTVCDWFPGMPLDEARRRFRTTLEIAANSDASAFIDGHDANASALHVEKNRKGGAGPGEREADVPDSLPAFWEDQLFAEDERNIVRFRIGDVAFEGSNPCARCPVPARDSRTGADLAGFQKRFSDLRHAQLPPWSPAARFDHFYRLATNTRIPSAECGKQITVSDPLILD